MIQGRRMIRWKAPAEEEACSVNESDITLWCGVLTLLLQSTAVKSSGRRVEGPYSGVEGSEVQGNPHKHVECIGAMVKGRAVFAVRIDEYPYVREPESTERTLEQREGVEGVWYDVDACKAGWRSATWSSHRNSRRLAYLQTVS